MAFIAPRLGDRFFSAVEVRIAAVVCHRRLTVLMTSGLALPTRAAVLSIELIPWPGIHEFSYLLSDRKAWPLEPAYNPPRLKPYVQ